jgi:IS4 transposase
MFTSSHFQQLLTVLPKHQIYSAIDQYEADKFSKGFSCFDQFIVMLYGQISGVDSLRGLVETFNSHRAHHYHLGTKEIKKSTLADANSKRNPDVFSNLAAYLINKCSRSIKKDGIDLLNLLDSTSITLKGRHFNEWTLENKNNRTQGIKVHTQYDDARQIPLSISFSAPNVNDITAASTMMIEEGKTYVFDKGYCDYNWWFKIKKEKAKFVTRFKTNAAVRVEEYKEISDKNKDLILEDCLVKFKTKNPRGGKVNEYYGTSLRRITVKRDNGSTLVLASNDLESPAETISQYYKRRWQIELFFKWMKQHLKIKKFVGRSENAVKIQILCAIIAYMLLSLYKQAQTYEGSDWQFMREIASNIFQRPDIEKHALRQSKKLLTLDASQPRLFS